MTNDKVSLKRIFRLYELKMRFSLLLSNHEYFLNEINKERLFTLTTLTPIKGKRNQRSFEST